MHRNETWISARYYSDAICVPSVIIIILTCADKSYRRLCFSACFAQLWSMVIWVNFINISLLHCRIPPSIFSKHVRINILACCIEPVLTYRCQSWTISRQANNMHAVLKAKVLQNNIEYFLDNQHEYSTCCERVKNTQTTHHKGMDGAGGDQLSESTSLWVEQRSSSSVRKYSSKTFHLAIAILGGKCSELCQGLTEFEILKMLGGNADKLTQ